MFLEVPDNALVGAISDRYEIVTRLRGGGMSAVYEARHVALGKRVAIKVLRTAPGVDVDRAVARFLREGKAAAQIRHPHVVDVFDIGVHEGVPFLVMELLEGTDLAALLAQKRRLTVDEAVDMFLPITSAVQAAHDLGVVHRDIKPGNLFLVRRPGGRLWPVVLDFGISKIANDDLQPSLTLSASILGTIPYMSPEQTQSAASATTASDQYSLGIVLYECVTGERPFKGDSQYALMHAIMTGHVAKPSAIAREVPPELDDIILRAIDRDPNRRFPSIREFGRALLPLAGPRARAIWAEELGAANMEIACGETWREEPAASPLRARGVRFERAPRGPWRRSRISFASLVALPLGLGVGAAVWSLDRTPAKSAGAAATAGIPNAGAQKEVISAEPLAGPNPSGSLNVNEIVALEPPPLVAPPFGSSQSISHEPAPAAAADGRHGARPSRARRADSDMKPPTPLPVEANRATEAARPDPPSGLNDASAQPAQPAASSMRSNTPETGTNNALILE